MIVQLQGEGKLDVYIVDASQEMIYALAERFHVAPFITPDRRLQVALQIEAVKVTVLTMAGVVPPESIVQEPKKLSEELALAAKEEELVEKDS